jgi:hypothetical protein
MSSSSTTAKKRYALSCSEFRQVDQDVYWRVEDVFSDLNGAGREEGVDGGGEVVQLVLV